MGRWMVYVAVAPTKINPRCLIEEYGVVVGHTLVDASSGSGSVLIVNPNAEVVVLPGLTLIGKLVPVAAISVAIKDTGPPNNGPVALREYLEEIVKGSQPSLGDARRPRTFTILVVSLRTRFSGAGGASYRPD